ncbi:hypothetical protein UlMin_040387 [Ulmus minor]
MDCEQRRKRKRVARPFSPAQYLSRRSLFLCLSFFVFLLFLSSDRFPVTPASFSRPVLSSSSFTRFYSSASNSVLDSFNNRGQIELPSRVEHRIFFPDQVLLLLGEKIRTGDRFECVYYSSLNGSDGVLGSGRKPEVGFLLRPMISSEDYNEFRSIVRCPLPPENYSASVDLKKSGGLVFDDYWYSRNNRTYYWDKVVYEAAMDRNSVVVFVKGLNLKPHKASDPSEFSCHFGMGNWENDESFVLTTQAFAAAQEVVRCLLPRSIRSNRSKAQGIRVTVSHPDWNARSPDRVNMPSVARIYNAKSIEERESRGNQWKKNKHELCVCTMVWNQASALGEWIMYHSWLGVGRWFIYDNNSDDGIEEVVQELDQEGYNVSRHSWPWIKTQEAGFSHCALRARDECNWVGYFDVDEFFYFPTAFRQPNGPDLPGKNSLRELVANYSSSTTIAEIRTDCHNFGPSGLSSPPSKGVTVGYTCRLQAKERHKSIVRPDMLDITLLNVVHHFKLREGFKSMNVPETTAMINHYKYQVWETFKAKFYRRVATYVVDWKKDQNKGSKDRAPGLGTEAIEPANWRLRFCEVWDTGLRDFVLTNFADPATGSLPWERESLV